MDDRKDHECPTLPLKTHMVHMGSRTHDGTETLTYMCACTHPHTPPTHTHIYTHTHTHTHTHTNTRACDLTYMSTQPDRQTEKGEASWGRVVVDRRGRGDLAVSPAQPNLTWPVKCLPNLAHALQGEEIRGRKRIWNRGNNRIKFMTIVNKTRTPDKQKFGANWDEPMRDVAATELDYSQLSTLLPADPALGGLPVMPRESE